MILIFFCSRQCMDVYDEKCETKYPAKCVEDQSCTMIYQTKCESSGYNQKCQQVPVQQCTPITKVNHFHENFRQIDFTEKNITLLFFQSVIEYPKQYVDHLQKKNVAKLVFKFQKKS